LLTDAIRRRRQHDMVAGLDLGDGPSNTLDNAGAFVSEDRGERCPQQAVLARDIGVADPDADDPDQDLVVCRIGHIDLLDNKRCVRRANDGGRAFHFLPRRSFIAL
jgi:hypothetical protein